MYLQVKKCRQDIVNKNNCHSNNNMEKHPDKKEIDNKKKKELTQSSQSIFYF